MDFTPDQVLNNRYRLVRPLGQGAMGAVYEAFDPVLNRKVAIKQLQVNPITGELAPEQIQQQFLREAQSLAGLHHPNLPRVTDFFTDNTLQYLVMDFVDGQTLQDILNRQPDGLNQAQVLSWADQLLSALEYIHSQNLIHRDIKPSNIRLTPDGRIFLVDFGLVKAYDAANPHTLTMMRGIGTPEYAPPEQYDTSDSFTDQRSDLFALGATLYHLLTGYAPATATRRMADPASFQPPSAHAAHISASVERVILRSLELDRTKRFQSAADMRAALKAAATEITSTSLDTRALRTELDRAADQSDRPSPTDRFRAPRWALIAIGAMVIAAVVFIAAQSGSPVAKPTPSAVPVADVKITQLSGSTTPEYVLIQNTGTAPQDLSGWYLESTIGPQTFNFPIGLTLNPSATLRLESYTGATNNPPSTLLWSTDPIWRNAGDKAVLRNRAGAAINTLCYGDACP